MGRHKKEGWAKNEGEYEKDGHLEVVESEMSDEETSEEDGSEKDGKQEPPTEVTSNEEDAWGEWTGKEREGRPVFKAAPLPEQPERTHSRSRSPPPWRNAEAAMGSPVNPTILSRPARTGWKEVTPVALWPRHHSLFEF